MREIHAWAFDVKLKEGDILRFYLSEELLSNEAAKRANDFREVSPNMCKMSAYLMRAPRQQVDLHKAYGRLTARFQHTILTPPLVCKLMRKKRIKLNGAKAEPNVKLKEGYSVYQRIRGVVVILMNRHSYGLVYQQYIFVLVYSRERCGKFALK